MIDLLSLNAEELKNYILEAGEKRFRADQIFSWIHEKNVRTIDEMTDIPLKLREYLKENASLYAPETVDLRKSEKDGTRKYLFRLSDDNLIESVWMSYREWKSVCVSSQAGCNMGCLFCASAIGGKVRDLTPGEMLSQVYEIGRDKGERVSNIVIMGSGEPLENYDNVLKFIRILNDEKGLNIGERHITLSTSGIVPGIRKLAEEGLKINLAVSLHTADDEKRKKLMPGASKYSVRELMGAAEYFFEKTGRRITVEYALIKDINDSDRDIELLSSLLSGGPFHVNLISVNPVPERGFKSVSKAKAQEFKSKLEKNGINVTIRREMGRDIEGACGQLRRRHLEA